MFICYIILAYNIMTLASVEKSDMLDRVLNFPTQVLEALEMKKELDLCFNYDKISNLVVLGMGGSGIVGDFIRVLLRNSRIPLYVNKHLLPPPYIDENSLVIGVTYSGKTRETLDTLWSCKHAGAKTVVVTGGEALRSSCYEGIYRV